MKINLVARFIGDLSRTIILFLPSIVFIVVAFISCCFISQAYDVFLVSLEAGLPATIELLAILYMAFSLWYASQLLYNLKFGYNTVQELERFKNAPRFFGYITFTVFQLAVIYSPVTISCIFNGNKVLVCYASISWIILNIFLYFIVVKMFKKETEFNRKYFSLKRLITFTIFLIALYGILNGLFTVKLRKDQLEFSTRNYMWLLSWFFIIIVIVQVLFLLFMTKGKNEEQSQLNTERFRKNYSAIFIVISCLMYLLFYLCIVSLYFSRSVTALPLAILGLTLLASLGNLATYYSIRWKTNIHLIFFAFAIIISLFTDRYEIRLIPGYETIAHPYQKRLTHNEYLERWTKSTRISSRDSLRKEPIFIVLSDGGASKSGYWVQLVLNHFWETDSLFPQRLLMMSGASGGSVGNAAFLAELQAYNRKELTRNECIKSVFLKKDYLSATIARYIGIDLLSYTPIRIIVGFFDDRSYAIEDAFERPHDGEWGNASEMERKTDSIIGAYFSSDISALIDTSVTNKRLPIFFLNTTRAQDGVPGVVSNVIISSQTHNKRIDILNLADDLDSIKGIRLSTCALLSARFPYVSPAGKLGNNYFVDGGYFDNSGSGICMETFQDYRLDSLDTSKYDYYVIHITNSPKINKEVKEISPLANDLFSPIKTIMGAYSFQTDINDLRFRKYIEKVFGPNHWIDISLYRDDSVLTEEEYPMNWLISERNLNRMKARLQENIEIKRIDSMLSERKNYPVK